MPVKEPYPSSFTDREWALLAPLLPASSKLGRPPRYPRRRVLEGILYIVRGGCGWRMLPHDLPPWRLCYYYFMTWRKEGLWQKIHDRLRDAVRLASGKKRAPTAAILDSQSVKVSNHGGVRGYDAGKKIMGRKRHLLVDTLGLILAVVVHPANLQDRDGARLVLAKLARAFGWVRLIWVDGGYAGDALAQWLKELLPRRGLRLEVVKRTELHTFKVLPKRWIVERTFGWLSNYRRFAKDYEYHPANSEALILIAASKLMLARLAR